MYSGTWQLIHFSRKPGMDIDENVLIGFAVALGSGLLIGIERERRKGSGPNRGLAGVRTFTLAAVSGALAQALDQSWLVLVGALLVLALVVISYWRDCSKDPGVTTEIALFITYLLGVAAISYPEMSAGTAVIVAGLLAARTSLHRFSKELLSTTELSDGLVLAGAALVVLPLLPNQSMAWLAGANPRRIWGLVVLLMTLQAAGYIALRIGGARLGYALSGLASGFVSSTATIAAMGLKARQQPELLGACVSGALFSNVATIPQLFLVAAAIHPAALATLAPSLLAGLACSIVIAAISLFADSQTDGNPVAQGHAFKLTHTLGFALILSIVTGAVALANSYFGQTAAGVAAAIAGFADAHAAATSVLSLGASGQLGPAQILWAVLLGFSTNVISKLVAATLSGGLAFASRVGAGSVVALAVVWLAYWFLR